MQSNTKSAQPIIIIQTRKKKKLFFFSLIISPGSLYSLNLWVSARSIIHIQHQLFLWHHTLTALFTVANHPPNSIHPTPSPFAPPPFCNCWSELLLALLLLLFCCLHLRFPSFARTLHHTCSQLYHVTYLYSSNLSQPTCHYFHTWRENK